jgi:hypothetical protein
LKKIIVLLYYIIWMVQNNITLRIIQLVHLLIDLLCMFYLFLFSALYDIYFCSFILLQTAHWMLLKNECIISYFEKKIINPQYQLGSTPRWIPHYDAFYNSYTKMLKAFFIIGSLLYVAFRNKKQHVKLICLGSIVLWIYLTYFHTSSRL